MVNAIASNEKRILLQQLSTLRGGLFMYQPLKLSDLGLVKVLRRVIIPKKVRAKRERH